jgi:hypothetical protein
MCLVFMVQCSLMDKSAARLYVDAREVGLGFSWSQKNTRRSMYDNQPQHQMHQDCAVPNGCANFAAVVVAFRVLGHAVACVSVLM